MQFCRLSKKARVLTAKLEMKRDTFLYLTCLHLDHRLERFRLKEIESIRQNLDQVFKANHCQIWTGDFNALTKEDYDTKQWYKKKSTKNLNFLQNCIFRHFSSIFVSLNLKRFTCLVTLFGRKNF